MGITFTEARREQMKLRAALIGPPGSGKTLGALKLAYRIGGPIFGVDTEHGRMKLYADRFRFQHANLTDTRPEGYVEALATAVSAGANVVVFDSLSHEWLAILTEADRFADWKSLTPRHNEFVTAIGASPVHVIVTMRAKVKYDVGEEEVNGRKRQTITRIGIGPVQRENIEYEFDVIGYLDETHEARFLNRCEPLVGKTMTLDAAAPIIAEWLESGEPDPSTERAPDGLVDELRRLLLAEGQKPDVVEESFEKMRRRSGGALTVAWVDEKLDAARARARGEDPPATRENTPPPMEVPKTWAAVNALAAKYGDGLSADSWSAWTRDASESLFGERNPRKLDRDQGKVLLQKSAGALVHLFDVWPPGGFPPVGVVQIREAWARVLDGVELPGPADAVGAAQSGAENGATGEPSGAAGAAETAGDASGDGLSPEEQAEIDGIAAATITGPAS